MRTAIVRWGVACGLIGAAVAGADARVPEAVTPPVEIVRAVAIVGGTVHPVAHPVIEVGVVVMEGGRITAVGAAADTRIPDGARIVDALGLHVWPGLIDCHSRLGLTEIGSVRGTRDGNESGGMNPNARAEVAVNASSSHFPVTRANGTMLAATAPSGGLVSGWSAVIALDGWTWEDMVRRAPLGLVVNWPGMRWKPKRDGKDDTPERPDWEKKVARLSDMLSEARAYGEARDRGEEPRAADIRWEALAPVVTGESRVWIAATTLDQIRAALDWTAAEGVGMVLVEGSGGGGGDAWQCAGELAARDVPVIVQTTRQPAHGYEPYDLPFREPALLAEAGVAIGFGTWGSAHARDLAMEAARAAGHGLARDAAARALTLGAAEILGIADRYGSLEAGKSATVLLVEGDLLDTSMQVRQAWIDGAEVDLSSRHTRLWRKWSARPR